MSSVSAQRRRPIMSLSEKYTYNKFEQLPMSESRQYTVINPFFFDYLRDYRKANQKLEVTEGVTINWDEGKKHPLVTIEDVRLHEDAHLFYQIFCDQLVEIFS